MADDDPVSVGVRSFRRELIGFVVLAVIATVGLSGTRWLASSNQKIRRDDARRWFNRGEHDAAADRSAAVEAFRRATAIDRDNPSYRLALARALAANGQSDAASQVLLALRQTAPDDPDMNMALARLAARRQQLTTAVQYYENALHGRWPPERENERRQLRVELITYLLGNDQRARALSELLILSANAPDDLVSQREVGELFLTAGDPHHALDHFRRALGVSAADATALVGAGEAAFALGDYEHARVYLRARGLPVRVAEIRAIADEVVTSDPLASHLGLHERQRRLIEGLDYARRRLHECVADPERLDGEAGAFARSLSPRAVRDDPDLIDRGVALIGRLQQAVSRGCSADWQTSDRAWTAIVARHDDEAS